LVIAKILIGAEKTAYVRARVVNSVSLTNGGILPNIDGKSSADGVDVY